MNELRLLEEKQIFGDNALDVIKKSGSKAAITDFAILLGGFVSDSNHITGYNSLDKRCGCYWTKTYKENNIINIVDWYGNSNNSCIDSYDSCVRLVTNFNNRLISSCSVLGRTKDGILEIEYGYYPKSAVSSYMQKILEKEYNLKQLVKSGRTYTTDMGKCFEEFKFNNKKYVRIESLSYNKKVTLSNGKTYKQGDIVWVMVEPVRWFIDEKENLMITKELIISGVPFNHERDYKGDFSTTDIKKFIDEYLSKELFQSQIINSKKNNDIMEDLFISIDQLRLSGYSSEQIRKITNSMLKRLENTNSNKIINCKKKVKCYKINKNR